MIGDVLLMLVGFGLGAMAGGWFVFGYARRDLLAAQAHVDGWRHVSRTLSRQIEGMLRQRRGCNGCAKLPAIVEKSPSAAEPPADLRSEISDLRSPQAQPEAEAREPWERPASWWRAEQ